jgi:hypothetical protein
VICSLLERIRYYVPLNEYAILKAFYHPLKCLFVVPPQMIKVFSNIIGPRVRIHNTYSFWLLLYAEKHFLDLLKK